MNQRNPFPHRDLSGKSEAGVDIERLERAANEVLRHRNQAKQYLVANPNGRINEQTLKAVRRAAYLLGLRESTCDAIRDGQITIAVQTVIRRPSLRNDRQRKRGHERMEAWRDKRQHAAEAHHGVAAATDAMELLLHNAAAAHYSMGGNRWEGIAHKLIAEKGSYPHYSDCSSSFTWAWWQVLGDGPDVLNGANWAAGYTGTLLAHGKRVSKDVEGAAALYGAGFPAKHVVYCIGGGKGISQGSEAAPFLVDLDYRADLMEFRVYA